MTKFDASLSALALAIPLCANPPAQAGLPDARRVSIPEVAGSSLPDLRVSLPLPLRVVRSMINQTRGAAR